jgi:hypothetical protein
MDLSCHIWRKEVPIEEMLAKVKRTPLNSPRLGTGRERASIDNVNSPIDG